MLDENAEAAPTQSACRRQVQSGKRKTTYLHSKDLKNAGPMVKTNQENGTTKRV
jgi:hypothetical protein